MRKDFIFLVLIFSLVAVSQRCFAQTQTLTAEIRKQTIDDLSALLPERYAYKELGPKLRQLLQDNLRGGEI